MITLYNLENSRSQRIAWLLEELGVDYEVQGFKRDPVIRLAPQALKDIHPLGKSPLISDNGVILPRAGQLLNIFSTTMATIACVLMPTVRSTPIICNGYTMPKARR